VSTIDRPADHRVASIAVRLVAGRSTWGRFDVWPSRYGFTHYRLVVLPPGSTAADRARLAVWRAWPIAAAVVGAGLLMACDAAGLPDAACWTVGALGAAVVLLVLSVPTRALRPLVRTRFGCVDDIEGTSAGDLRDAEEWALFLQAADRGLQDGRLTVPQHEVAWGTAWRALERTR
jgi:hypothetical protein